MSKLPPRTPDEELGIKMMQDALDVADYCVGGPFQAESEEAARLMNLGMKRFFAEEFEIYEDELNDGL